MMNCHNDVPFLKNPRLLLGDLRSTMGAGQASDLPLTERAGRVCAASDFKIMQVILSSLGEHVAGSHVLNQPLPSEVRQIGPGCARRVAKMLHHIAWAH